MKCVLCLPTLNAATSLPPFLDALAAQSLANLDCLAIDSASEDKTAELLIKAGFVVLGIARHEFNHGATRQLAAELCREAEILIFLTQDAVPACPEALANLVTAFEDPTVGAAYGRQLPRKSSGPIEAHARLFNYAAESLVKSLADISSLGIKTAFISNSFAAYRCSALQEIGGFPLNTIVSEDTYVAAKMLEAGWKIKYCADARVYHSHNYSMSEELQRYFDIGVFHSREPWIRSRFGRTEGEGRRFFLSQLAYLKQENVWLIPSSILRNLIKYLGFRLGLCEAHLFRKMKVWLSMQKNFWHNDKGVAIYRKNKLNR